MGNETLIGEKPADPGVDMLAWGVRGQAKGSSPALKLRVFSLRLGRGLLVGLLMVRKCVGKSYNAEIREKLFSLEL
jgi:hypothetical protein